MKLKHYVLLPSDFVTESAIQARDDPQNLAPECVHRFYSANHETVPPMVTCLRCSEPLPICAECFQPHAWHLIDCPVPERERAARKRRRLCST